MDPFVGLTLAAGVTRRIKLGTGICLLPEREPLITAKTIATLDIVSGGRVILGVGAGWLKEETEAMGAVFATRWKRLRETVEAVPTRNSTWAGIVSGCEALLSNRINPLE